jgi:SOS-response transcriptional repressor LexA
MRNQHRWVRQQLICCFIHTYTQAHHLPPTVREIGAWVGCPGMRSLQLALADLERQQYLARQSHAQRSIVLTAKGIVLAQRWQLLVLDGETNISPYKHSSQLLDGSLDLREAAENSTLFTLFLPSGSA